MTSIIEVIQHYQRSIDSSQENEARLLHCINKLYKLPIKVEHLQETGIGKTVNSLRKFNGEIGVAAKTLVTKWKAMVAAEEEPMETNSHTNENETHNDTNGDGGGGGGVCETTAHEEENDENHNRSTTMHKNEDTKHSHSKDTDDKQRTHSSSSSNGHKDSSKHSTSTSLDHQRTEKASKNSTEKHKSSSRDKSSSGSSEQKDKEREKEKKEYKSNRDRHKERDQSKEKERRDKNGDEKSKSVKEKKDESRNRSHSPQLKSNSHTSSSKSKHEDNHSHSSSSKNKERSDKHKSSSRDKERSKEENHSVHSSSSKEGPKFTSTSSSSKSTNKEQNCAERKRRHNSDNESIEFKSPQPKVTKVHKSASPSNAPEEEGTDESFDSSMGANFDDVLGMLNMPVKKGKKSLKSPSTPLSNSNSATKKDKNTHRLPATSTSSIISNKLSDTRMTLTPNSSSSYPTAATLKTLKPDLLAPTAKLEPLDPSIVLELPTISTNYKPMPLNQTVMDCVFNNSSSTPKPVRTLTDDEAIAHGISSKTMRTKIYSGVRTGQTFQVPTLFDMCIRLLQKNIDALEYTGGVPFEVLKPVLERASPQQLYVFEEYNPYLMEDSDVLWQQHVSRTYRTKKRMENESWREMFIRCQEEEERKLSVLKDSIKASQKIAAAPVRKTQLAFVDSMVKPPRNVIRKQEQFGTKAKLVATPAARVASLSSVTPNAGKMGDQRLKVPTAVRDHAQVSSSAIRPKKAPLMQKTLQFIRGRHKR